MTAVTAVRHRGRTRRATWRRVAVGTSVALAAGGCSRVGIGHSTLGPLPTAPSPATTVPATTVPAPPTVGSITWSVCLSDQGPRGAECATVPVPLDYANPNGAQISLALDRHRATGTREGALLINPGGPGASGVDGLETVLGILSPAVLAHFDIIGFDPRGVARSAPIRCLSGPELDQYYHLDPAPSTDAGFQALVDAARRFDQACQANSGAILAHVGTVDAARDMEQIRVAIGADKLNYFGFSYGTLLGATYAEEFPDHIRAMVLDGAIDPAQDATTLTIAQSGAFNAELDAFFADCTSARNCAWHPGGDLRAAFDALTAGLKSRPLPAGGGRSLGPGEAFYGVALPLYDRASWPDLAAALEQATQGDGSGLLHLSDLYTTRAVDGTYSNEQDANTAVSCDDYPWPSDPAAIRALGPRAAATAPEFGIADLYGGLSCSMWPVEPTRSPHPITAPGSPPIVVIGSTGDPATPYGDAVALASELTQGVLVTRQGDGHTGYRSSSCVRAHVDAYLLSLTVPAKGISCPSDG